MSQDRHRDRRRQDWTNVYADLGNADAAEMQRKSRLAAEIARAIKARRLTQRSGHASPRNSSPRSSEKAALAARSWRT